MTEVEPEITCHAWLVALPSAAGLRQVVRAGPVAYELCAEQADPYPLDGLRESMAFRLDARAGRTPTTDPPRNANHAAGVTGE